MLHANYGPFDWKSAIQQTGSLHYVRAAVRFAALMRSIRLSQQVLDLRYSRRACRA